MPSLSVADMRAYLRRSISSLNQNKIRGLLAEVELRQHLRATGYDGRVSRGGWIVRRDGPGEFGRSAAVIFPEVIQPDVNYADGRVLPNPPNALHAICANFHQRGIASYYCAATVLAPTPVAHVGFQALCETLQLPVDNIRNASLRDLNTMIRDLNILRPEVQRPTLTRRELNLALRPQVAEMRWSALRLGVPGQEVYRPFPDCVRGDFRARATPYNFLRYDTDSGVIPEHAVPDEFSKEHLRVTFQNEVFCEISDLDGIFWGQRFTYPLEIKEKTVATDTGMGDWFGLDIGPFSKLAFYAAKQGDLRSLFIVREIDNVSDRNLVGWWFVPFDTLAEYASWFPMAGGTGMMGGASAVVRVPKHCFRPLDAANLAAL